MPGGDPPGGRVDDHDAHEHRTGPRAPAHLVEAADEPVALTQDRALEAQARVARTRRLPRTGVHRRRHQLDCTTPRARGHAPKRAGAGRRRAHAPRLHWPDARAPRRRRPAHALGPRVVRALPDLPDATRRARRRALGPHGVGPLLRAVPPRRPDGRRRRLPRGPPRARGATPAALRGGADRGGPLVRPHGRVLGLGRDARARPAARAAARGVVRGHRPRSGYLPDMFGHVAQMPQLLGSRGFEHAVVWRGVPSEITASAFRVARAGRERGALRSTCSTATATAPRSPTTRRPSCARTDDHVDDVRLVPRGRRALDERLGPPACPSPSSARLLAEANRAPGRLRASSSRASPTTSTAPRARGSSSGRASCAAGSEPTCSWASPRTAWT